MLVGNPVLLEAPRYGHLAGIRALAHGPHNDNNNNEGGLAASWPLSAAFAALPADPYELISLLTGYCSIACWICVFTPQLFQNYRRKSGDSLSVPFLVIWLLGDLFNVAGVLLQGLLSTMLWLAVYYTFADVGLIVQVYYYRCCKRISWEEELSGGSSCRSCRQPSPDCPISTTDYRNPPVAFQDATFESATHSQRNLPLIIHATTTAAAGSGFVGPGHNDPRQNCHPASPYLQELDPKRRCMSRAILYGVVGFFIGCMLVSGFVVRTVRGPTGGEVERGGRYFGPLSKGEAGVSPVWAYSAPLPGDDKVHPLAQLLGWVSASLYVGSRVPQLVKNFRNKTCEGLSFSMFAMAVMGNVTYTLSILIMLPVVSARQPNGSDDVRTYMAKTFPWLTGSAGTLVFDFIILTQFFLYRHTAGEVQTETTRLLRERDRRI